MANADAGAGGAAGVAEPPRRRQLRMRRPDMHELPPLEVPPGYGLRTFRPGDEAAWGAIMESTGGIGTGWTVERVRERMLERPQFRADGLFFATADAEGGRPVASAAAWRNPPEDYTTGYVHMVCALPSHRGRGLGRLVTLATLHHMREHGFRDVILETDDFRVPAVRTYLGLGFVPVYVEDPASDHVARWSALFKQLFSRQKDVDGPVLRQAQDERPLWQ